MLDSLSLEVEFDWTEVTPRAEVRRLRFQLPNKNLALHSARTEIVKITDRWNIEQFSAQLGNTRLKATGTVQPSPRDPTTSTLDLKLAESQLDNAELQRLSPRFPLRDVLTVEGRVGGSLNRFVVNQLRVSHDRSTATIEGTASGLPNTLTLDAELVESQVHPQDVSSVWPEAPVDRASGIGTVNVRGTLSGQVEWEDQPHPTFNLEATIGGKGRPGAVRGSLDVRRSETRRVQYSSRLSLDSLNLAPITGNPAHESRLTGDVDIRGSGVEIGAIQGEGEVHLSSSQVGPRRLASADLNVEVDRRRVTGTLAWEQSTGGTLTLQGRLNSSEAVPEYSVRSTLSGFNLADTSTALPSTRLSGSVSVDGQGHTWETLQGTATASVDSSIVLRGDSLLRLPPHEMRVALNDSSSESPRLRVDGTIASGQVDGPFLHPVFRSSGQLWATAAQEAVEREVANAARPSFFAERDTAITTGDALDAVLSRAREVYASSAQSTPVQLSSSLVVHRMDLLRRWWPDAPTKAEGLRARSSLTMSPDTLTLSGDVYASKFEMHGRSADSLTASYHLSSPYRSNPVDALTATISAEADTFQFNERSLVAPSATLTLAERDGALHARAEGMGPTGPFRLTSDVRVDDGATFQITDLYVGAGQHAWLSDHPGTVSVYSDALVVDSLALESSRPLAESMQQIQIYGALSDAPSDTLHAHVSDVLLYPMGQLASTTRSIGGRLTGQIAVTGGLKQPQVRSSFNVHRLSLDRRVLGSLHVRTRLTPNTPDLLVDAALESEAPVLDSLEGPAMVPQGPRAIEENQLDITGRIRLPGWTEKTVPADPRESDQLDLTVDIERVDLFFFKYIFDETLAKAQGYTAGSVHVGGDFQHPLFDADLGIQNARFTLPKFGLSYTASGPVSVDRQGIHTVGLEVEDGNGSATVTGSVLFNEYRYFSFDLSAELRELEIIDVTDAEELPFYGQISASGPARLTGPLQDATLRSDGARTTPDSELFIPVSEGDVEDGSGFIVFADSTGQIPNLRDLTRRDNILSDRPAGEPSFLDGLEIDINVLAPEESTVHLVFDPIVGDVVTAQGTGRIQLQRREGEFFVYGNFDVSGGTYLFTAGEVFVRRFNINGGTITWDGPPTNAQLNLEAEYRTRASRAGLPGYREGESRIPIRVLLDIGGRVETPEVELSLARVRDQRNNLVGSETLDAILNQADRTTEYATSVLLTNTFLLTTESFTEGGRTGADGSTSGSLSTTGPQLAFNSVSQLVASQLNRYLGAALPNVDLNLGLQGENPNDLDLIYGVALRLLNERLVIRGEGVYTGEDPSTQQANGPQGEFVMEVRLSNRVSVEAFYRRQGDELTRGETLTSSRGAGLSYQTEFSSWTQLFGRLFGWLWPNTDSSEDATENDPDPVARESEERLGASNSEPEASSSKN